MKLGTNMDLSDKQSIVRRTGPDNTTRNVTALLFLGVYGLAAWALLTVFNHEGRIIRTETRVDNSAQILAEMREDIKDIKKQLERRP